ncbi:MAG TPA: hypothetical protein DEA61_08700 [Caldanaerobacter subterraneus]|uniref:Uncharacterized protein n=1 Tax=Caldanaerobacter subterraneus TaxID=911092 RepID=A0A357VNT9_9THEO|nr:hypothetical protein [Caldanaerobacter subterraneus]
MTVLRWQQVKDPLLDAPPVLDSGSGGCRQPSGCGRNGSAQVPAANIGEEGAGESPSWSVTRPVRVLRKEVKTVEISAKKT